MSPILFTPKEEPVSARIVSYHTTVERDRIRDYAKKNNLSISAATRQLTNIALRQQT